MNAPFDENKYFLGKLCRSNHEYENTGQSLRYKSTRECPECVYFRSKTYRQNNKDKFSSSAKNYRAKRQELYRQLSSKNKFKLGTLCLYNHEFESTGRSLRYQTGHCVECQKIRAKKYRENNPEAKHKYDKLWQKNNPEKVKIRNKKYREANPEKEKAYGRLYRQNNRERIKIKDARYRNRIRQAHQSAYTREDITFLCRKFGNACAYCGAKSKLHIDHWHPIYHGGTDTLGNLLPCCQSCNSSKRDREGRTWYAKQPFYSKRRWRKIENHLSKAVCKGQLTLF